MMIRYTRLILLGGIGVISVLSNIFPEYTHDMVQNFFDGNIVIMVDTSPAVMIIPTNVFDIIEEADDFNFSPMIGTYIRLSRFFFTLLTVFLTPVWLLLESNPQWVPEWLKFITISEDITVPVILQLFILELAVDGLKLAAVNTPGMLSTPLSILAGIVVGEYAVESGWFNSESLLYMAVVTVGTYSQASFEMGYALKIHKNSQSDSGAVLWKNRTSGRSHICDSACML